MNQLESMRMWVQFLALLSGLEISHCCELWCRLAAVAPIRLLAWEILYAAGEALKRQRKKKEVRRKKGKEGRKEEERKEEKKERKRKRNRGR